MTQDQAKELLPVFNAYAEGKTVQWASQPADDWADYRDNRCEQQQPCIFLNPRFRWRVKPEPREWYRCESCHKALSGARNTMDGVLCYECGCKVVHVREVLK
jgi:hypothetical protein